MARRASEECVHEGRDVAQPRTHREEDGRDQEDQEHRHQKEALSVHEVPQEPAKRTKS